MPDEIKEPGAGDEGSQGIKLEMPSNPFGQEGNDSQGFDIEFSRNPLVQITIWAELEAHRIAWKQMGYKPELIEEENELNFPRLIGELKKSDLEANHRFGLWVMHHVRRTKHKMYIDKDRVNENFPKIEPGDSSEVASKKIFDATWDSNWRKRRPHLGGDLDSPKGEPLGEPCEQPRPPYWLMK